MGMVGKITLPEIRQWYHHLPLIKGSKRRLSNQSTKSPFWLGSTPSRVGPTPSAVLPDSEMPTPVGTGIASDLYLCKPSAGDYWGPEFSLGKQIWLKKIFFHTLLSGYSFNTLFHVIFRLAKFPALAEQELHSTSEKDTCRNMYMYINVWAHMYACIYILT